MSEVSLQHGMTRQMAVSQSMQTGMRILQASALELRQIVRQALETNPMLEELPDASPEALEDGPDGMPGMSGRTGGMSLRRKAVFLGTRPPAVISCMNPSWLRNP